MHCYQELRLFFPHLTEVIEEREVFGEMFQMSFGSVFQLKQKRDSNGYFLLQ
jgi:hypothetical protein